MSWTKGLTLHKTFKPGLYQAEVFKRRYGDEVSFDVDIFPKYILSINSGKLFT